MKKTFKKIDGVLLLDKAIGESSNRAMLDVKYLLQAAKAGHTGSLDPLASGVLPICFGEATKFARFLLDAHKTYEVSALLGVTTDSGDSTGIITATNPVPNFSKEEIEAHIAKFLGNGLQVPSMFSALKHNGTPLYKLARQNISVERKARAIEILEYELLEFNENSLKAKITCSKGTYVRTLIEDLGQSLGCGAHVTALRRTAAGPFKIEHCKTLNELKTESDISSLLQPPITLLGQLPQIILSAPDVTKIRNGQEICAQSKALGMVCLLSEAHDLLGIGEAQNDGNIVAVRLVAWSPSVI